VIDFENEDDFTISRQLVDNSRYRLITTSPEGFSFSTFSITNGYLNATFNPEPPSPVPFAGGPIEIFRLDGMAFSLESIDVLVVNSSVLADFGVFIGDEPYITGTRADGTILRLDVTAQTDDPFQTVQLGAEWSNLTEVAVRPALLLHGNSGAGFSANDIDNLLISAVPVPAAAWLFLSGLSVLGLRRCLR